MQDMMGLKAKILEELLGDLDSQEGENIRPKSVGMEVMMKKDGDSMMDAANGEGESAPDGMSDDDLKMLMEEYLRNK